MAKRGGSNGVGFGKPPRHRRFQPGTSGNPKGRPKGSRNFASVMTDELNDRVPVTENGRRRKITKREVMIKQVVNKAAGGDLKAVQTILNETRSHELVPTSSADLAVFDTPEHRLVMAEIVRRIRSSSETLAIVPGEESDSCASNDAPEGEQGGAP